MGTTKASVMAMVTSGRFQLVEPNRNTDRTAPATMAAPTVRRVNARPKANATATAIAVVRALGIMRRTTAIAVDGPRRNCRFVARGAGSGSPTSMAAPTDEKLPRNATAMPTTRPMSDSRPTRASTNWPDRTRVHEMRMLGEKRRMYGSSEM